MSYENTKSEKLQNLIDSINQLNEEYNYELPDEFKACMDKAYKEKAISDL
ncbi:MAG: hypothetical protein JXB17_07925 [Bacteroidales bacterium]|nr:hypothetical protein [Bacteroidales bacterium]